MVLSKVTPSDALEWAAITFEWADSYDSKDWDRLNAILAPALLIDYSNVLGRKWESMPAHEFIAMISDQKLLGDPLVHTQHFIGGSRYEQLSDATVVGTHQIRAAHQRYTSLDRTTVEAKGHGHALMHHTYKRIQGEWRLAGIKPTLYWNEFEFERIFPDLDV